MHRIFSAKDITTNLRCIEYLNAISYIRSFERNYRGQLSLSEQQTCSEAQSILQKSYLTSDFNMLSVAHHVDRLCNNMLVVKPT
jgi:hypothetical protein